MLCYVLVSVKMSSLCACNGMFTLTHSFVVLYTRLRHMNFVIFLQNNLRVVCYDVENELHLQLMDFDL